ncbi:MAG TPA: HepT-like ribonuclease domain-containing protein, partial [Candidatus Binatia bacterium]|nr:HepT-like ribonuclease domain-containing protein [Candidatus Binatia bacterium]
QRKVDVPDRREHPSSYSTADRRRSPRAVKDERVYLGHIRDAINDIKAYASGEEAFLADRMRQDAIIRKLEIIGEAVKRLSDETRARRPEIPWKQIAGMRDRLTHD